MTWLSAKTKPPKFIKVNLDPSEMHNKNAPYISGKLPQLSTYQELALWLNLTQSDLAWFADIKNWQAKTVEPKLQHYNYQWLTRPRKTPRLLETPKPCMKSIQRQILRQILDKVTPHDAVHGFRKGRSCITHAQQHTQKEALLRMDIRDFFTSITQNRIYGLFYSLGYPKHISSTLGALCTNTPNPDMLGDVYHTLSWKKQKLITQPHLPQGAPTSPALANLCCWKLDKRLEGLAQKSNITYSRYADDMAFSGGKNLYKSNMYFRKTIEQIVDEEGFLINHTKTFTKTKSQQQSLVGIVVNEHPNISRREYDKIKAILHNCKTHGFDGQNQDQHNNFQEFLRGKIAYINSINPPKGEKLQNIYQKIQW
ncbi:MAG: reverse transcriptase family protein [Alphaproteobacteria bacterium]